MELEPVSLATNLGTQAALSDAPESNPRTGAAGDPAQASKSVTTPGQQSTQTGSHDPGSKSSGPGSAAYQVTLSITSQMRALELSGETPSQIASALNVPESQVDTDLGITATTTGAASGGAAATTSTTATASATTASTTAA